MDSEDEEPDTANTEAPPPPPPEEEGGGDPAEGAAATNEADEAPPAEEDGQGGGSPQCGEFLNKETGKLCKVIFCPDGARLNTVKLQQLQAFWKIPPINVMLSADCGTVHPKQFASPKLTQLKQFAVFWKDAMRHAEKQGRAPTGDEQETFALNVINDVIYLKLVTIFCSVLDASEIADNVIVVDRINAKSPAAELLIEAALAATTAIGPYSKVV